LLSYFKHYILKTQLARKSIVLKLYGYAAAFRPDVWGVWSHKWEGFGGVRGCRNITAEPPVGVRGRSPPAADEVFVFKTVIFNASRPTTVFHEMMYCLSCFFCKVSK